MPEPATPGPGRIDSANQATAALELAEWTRSLRRRTRLTALLLIFAAAWLGGSEWAEGALWGGLTVEANLSLLAKFFDRAQAWTGGGLRGTLAGFYLAFAATAGFCCLVIIRGWGSPLAFLLGLSVFWPGLLAGLSARPFRASARRRP